MAMRTGEDPLLMHQGYLTKQGKMVMNWKRRWFQLRVVADGMIAMAYYNVNSKNKQTLETSKGSSSSSSSSSSSLSSNKKPSRYIPLRTESTVVKEGELPHKGRTPPCKDKARHFSIHTPGTSRTFYLFADSETEAREWVLRLNQLLTPSMIPLQQLRSTNNNNPNSNNNNRVESEDDTQSTLALMRQLELGLRRTTSSVSESEEVHVDRHQTVETLRRLMSSIKSRGSHLISLIPSHSKPPF